MSLRSTQSLTEMTTRDITGEGGKDGRCIGLTNLPPSGADCLEILEPKTSGTLRACHKPEQGLLYFAFTVAVLHNGHDKTKARLLVC